MARHRGDRLAAVAGIVVMALVVGSRPGAAAFPGANGAVVFVDRDQIFTMNARGSARRQLTTSGSNGHPAWSPDGRQILYASFGAAPGIYVMFADGSEFRRIVSDPAGVLSSPTWAPDGRRIAYTNAQRGVGRPDLYVANADGSAPRLLRERAFEPAWAPNGDMIAFSSFDARGSGIFVINADGSGERQLTLSNRADHDPAWSPDGSQIAFVSLRTGTFEIYVVNADGTGLRQLTSGSSSPCASEGCSIPMFGPTWSPDGSKILFAYDGGGPSQLYITNPDGTGQTPIAPLEGRAGSAYFPDAGTPDWQPAADLALTARPRLATVRVGGRAAVVLTARNRSPLPATRVRVALRLRGSATIASAGPTAGSCRVRRSVTCTVAALAPNGVLRISVRIRVKRVGIASLAATATSATPDASVGNDATAVRIRTRR